MVASPDSRRFALSIVGKSGSETQRLCWLSGEGGIDREATLMKLQSSKTPPLEKGLLRSIISGNLRLGERLYKAGIWSSPECMFCGHQQETLEHCFWKCPAWHSLRLDPDLPAYHERNTLPPCTLQCGIFMRSPQEVTCEHDVQPQIHVPYVQPVVPLREGACEICADGRVVIWTDGACPQNQFRHLRRGVCGIWYHDKHPRNASFSSSGPEQTNQRA